MPRIAAGLCCPTCPGTRRKLVELQRNARDVGTPVGEVTLRETLPRNPSSRQASRAAMAPVDWGLARTRVEGPAVIRLTRAWGYSRLPPERASGVMTNLIAGDVIHQVGDVRSHEADGDHHRGDDGDILRHAQEVTSTSATTVMPRGQTTSTLERKFDLLRHAGREGASGRLPAHCQRRVCA